MQPVIKLYSNVIHEQKVQFFGGSDFLPRLDVHLEKTHFISSDFESALPELRKQACLSGADAIIEIQEQSTGYLEMRSYHVTATGIKYK
jgi:hypothetical protein